jgi:nucleoside 2-deoxyribosyltransferase
MTIKPRIYCASPAHRAKMWRGDPMLFTHADRVRVISTWHNNAVLLNGDVAECIEGWTRDLAEIRQADVLVAYAEHKDRPNGTLVEIGYAIAHDTPVALVGNFEWGTWRHLPLVTFYPTLREAFASISGVTPDDPS